MKILITELIWPVGIERLKEIGEIEYDPTLWQKRELLLEKIRNVDAVIVRNQTVLDSELLQRGTKLKVIGRLGVGLDNINLDVSKILEIKVVYGRNANAISVAEYVMAALLEASRSLSSAILDVKKGNWNRKLFTKSELYGKTLGLVGMGEIAHRVAKRAAGFGLNLIGYDPFFTEYDFQVAESGIQLVDFYKLITQSDFISIHVPLTAETKSMFSTEQFNKMKGSSYLINTSRGGIIDERELCDAVKNGRIAGAFLDVLENEPIQPHHPLLDCPNVFITPHIAGLTEESQGRISLLVAEEVGKVLKGEPSLCVVRY